MHDEPKCSPRKLSNSTLDTLPENILRPTYDRQEVKPGIIHIGVGNFHRAHLSWYQHRLMQLGHGLDWAIIGAGIRPYDAIMRNKLLKQDCMTTLIELDPLSRSAEVVGSMIDYLPIEEGNTSLIRRMAEPEIRIVSMTVTEGGYYIDPATNTFDSKHPDIIHDVEHPERPKTVFGIIIAALRMRQDAGLPPFTGLSCDNLQGNGNTLRNTILQLARASDPDLAIWINDNCSFPNSMVDCIVPATGPKEMALAQELGIDDQVPVTHENFRQWVVEDDFCAGRPAWEKVGVTFSDVVHDYELMKIRTLNAGHQIIAAPAEILGIKTIAESMGHPAISQLFRKIANTEIVPHIRSVPGMSPETYVEVIFERFSNPRIIDTTRRVAFDGATRHPAFLFPTIRDALEAGTPIEGLALVEAAWARMCQGNREDGSRIEPNDPRWGELQARAQAARSDPSAWTSMRTIYGDLADEPRFTEAFGNWLGIICDRGIEVAIEQYCVGGTE